MQGRGRHSDGSCTILAINFIVSFIVFRAHGFNRVYSPGSLSAFVQHIGKSEVSARLVGVRLFGPGLLRWGRARIGEGLLDVLTTTRGSPPPHHCRDGPTSLSRVDVPALQMFEQILRSAAVTYHLGATFLASCVTLCSSAATLENGTYRELYTSTTRHHTSDLVFFHFEEEAVNLVDGDDVLVVHGNYPDFTRALRKKASKLRVRLSYQMRARFSKSRRERWSSSRQQCTWKDMRRPVRGVARWSGAWIGAGVVASGALRTQAGERLTCTLLKTRARRATDSSGGFSPYNKPSC